MSDLPQQHCPSGFTFTALSAWRDQLLPDADARRMQAHLPGCATCRARLDSITTLGQMLGTQRELLPGDRVWLGVRRRLNAQSTKGNPMRSRAFWGSVSALVVVVMFGALFAYLFATAGGKGSSIIPPPPPTLPVGHPTPVGTTVPGLTPTPTSPSQLTPPPSPTPPPANPCMPPGAQYPDILRGIPISPTTFLSNLTEGAADGVAYSYTVYKVTACTVNASPASVRAYFAAHMPQHGWTQTSDFPDGYAGKCADHYCWTVSTGAKTARFVGLLNVQADNGNTVFVLDVLTLTYNS